MTDDSYYWGESERIAKEVKTDLIDRFKNLKTVADVSFANESQLQFNSRTIEWLEVIPVCCIPCMTAKINLVRDHLAFMLVGSLFVAPAGPYAIAWCNCYNETIKKMRPEADKLTFAIQHRN